MKKSMFSLLAVIVMAGCTQSDVIELVSNENVEIKLSSSAIAAETMTRAPYEGTIGTNGSLPARVTGFYSICGLYCERIVCE